jgi:copper chaperone
MNEQKFRTTIKCAGCVAKVTPFLNEAVGESNWKVDYENPEKVLTVTQGDDKSKVIQALEKAGYKGEAL